MDASLGGRRARSSSGGSAGLLASNSATTVAAAAAATSVSGGAGNTGTTGRLRRQRSREWRDRQYSTSEEEREAAAAANSLLTAAARKQRSSPTPAVYNSITNSVLTGYSSAERSSQPSSLNGVTYRTGTPLSTASDTEVTDNPTSPFPTPPASSSPVNAVMYSSAAMQQNQPRQSSPYPLESTNTAASPRGGSISSSAGIYAEPQPPSSQQRFLNRHYNKGSKGQSQQGSGGGPGSRQQTPSQASLQSSRGRMSASSRRAAAAAAAAQVGGTSTSSSDNMSDATYPESEMVKDSRLHLENDMPDSPPEPAPPEVPPRGPSLHHGGHATLRQLHRGGGGGGYSPESPAAPGILLLGENESEISAGYHTATPSANNYNFLSQGKSPSLPPARRHFPSHVA